MACNQYFPILTWHSANVTTQAYSGNDLVAFEQDLQTLDHLGWTILPLEEALTRLLDEMLPEKSLALTCDDGCLLDWRDFEHPSLGRQGNLRRIMEDFRASAGHDSRHRLHLSSFVIASPQARAELDATAFQGLGLLPDDWWKDANRSGLMSIENHSWDHNHGLLAHTAQKDNRRGDFSWIDTLEECRIEVDQANDYISLKAGRRPRFFAYPYGQASDYLRQEYLPRFAAATGLRAALGCEPEPASCQSDIWYLPRYVCGRDWSTTDELEQLLNDLS